MQLDELCDRFESAWLAGQSPRIENFLEEVPTDYRGEAVRELLKLDVHYRGKSGDSPALEEYRERFPSVASVWLRELLEPSRSAAAAAARASRPANPWLDASANPLLSSKPGELFTTPGNSAARDRSNGSTNGLPRLPGYEVLELIGRGGMGVVYKARDLRLQRLVALKMISAGAAAGPEMLDRFRAEARAVASLQHPHLVQIYEVGEQDGRPYLVFEFMAGGSLDARLGGAPQSPRSSAQLIKTVAQAIQFAHSRGFIHRDLKPANILLTGPLSPASDSGAKAGSAAKSAAKSGESDASSSRPGLDAPFGENRSSRNVRATSDSWRERESDLPKVGDFGLAKHLESGEPQTRTGAILGTPSYMAPEQADGRSRAIGPTSDVYALGAILYEMLTGRPPFRAPTVLETLDQVRQAEPVSLRRIQPTVPRDLETICLKCLQKDSSRRYESAGALADDLDRFLHDEPVLARPVSTTERTWRWCRRHPVVATLAVLLLVVTFGGIGG
ncbi:MAG TPA: serine/threonine-protein kinase, partial [Pirellulaceae bacterium]|nr:serine/threonine-protein kinase [Pirellulaceae bacterium]